MSDVEIRDAVVDDFAGIRAFLDSELRLDYFVTGEQLRDILTRRWHSTWLAIDDGSIVGLAIVTKAFCTLVNLLVAENCRRRGIGDRLLQAAKPERIRAKLDVHAGDPRQFYVARGYRATGEFNLKGNIAIMVYDIKNPPSWGADHISPLLPLLCDLTG